MDVIGSLPAGGRKYGPIELYDRGRYMTLTGLHVEGTPGTVEERTGQMKQLHAEVFETGSLTGMASDLGDAVLSLTLSTSTKNDALSRLWRGDTAGHGRDDSAADFALCKELAKLTRAEPNRIDRLFRQSGLMRPKWDEPRGAQTYGQLTIAKATNGLAQGNEINRHPRRGAPAALAEPVLVSLATVTPETIDWLWEDRIALGKTTLLCGDPGLGKSWLTLDIAARVSTGRSWPNGGRTSNPRNVLLMSAEDGLADTIRPRLDALGADVERISHWAVVRAPNSSERGVQLTDVDALAAAIDASRAELVIIDPVTAYLGGIDAHRDSEVRGLLAPIMRIAEERHVAVIVVMHLAKNSQRPAIHRPGGSIGFIAFSRVALAVARHPHDDGLRVLFPLKSNISVDASALVYSIVDGRLEWDAEPLREFDRDALLSGTPSHRQNRLETDEWLEQQLANGPVQAATLQSHAKRAGFAWRTVNRSKKRLGVITTRAGFGDEGSWTWALPTSDDMSTDNSNSLAFNAPAAEIPSE